MCMLCVEIQKNRMKLHEVRRALPELFISEEHREELDLVIFEKFGVSAIQEDAILTLDQERQSDER